MVKVEIAKTYFQKEDGKLDLDESLLMCGHFAGVCYDAEGYNHIKTEDYAKTERRIALTKDNGHHSVYDHIYMSLNITDLPKILAMVLNNEHEYTTSEKSARYTEIKNKEVTDINSNNVSQISHLEVELYNKWLEIFKSKIKEQYGYFYKDNKIKKLAQENARYLVTVFMPTTMVYTTSLRQINYIVSWLNRYIKEHDINNPFENKLSQAMEEFVKEIERLNILDAGLLNNDKDRKISLFAEGFTKRPKVYSDVYTTYYKGTFAEYAQAQRHRTLFYQLELLKESECFVPPIIQDDEKLVQEWLNDMAKVYEYYPQGMLVNIYERGIYENFILKCKERLCSAAQLEIMLQTRKTLMEYKEALEKANDPLAIDIVKYTKGARCTFPDFTCCDNCGFKEGINLTRKI